MTRGGQLPVVVKIYYGKRQNLSLILFSLPQTLNKSNTKEESKSPIHSKSNILTFVYKRLKDYGPPIGTDTLGDFFVDRGDVAVLKIHVTKSSNLMG